MTKNQSDSCNLLYVIISSTQSRRTDCEQNKDCMNIQEFKNLKGKIIVKIIKKGLWFNFPLLMVKVFFLGYFISKIVLCDSLEFGRKDFLGWKKQNSLFHRFATRSRFASFRESFLIRKTLNFKNKCSSYFPWQDSMTPWRWQRKPTTGQQQTSCLQISLQELKIKSRKNEVFQLADHNL